MVRYLFIFFLLISFKISIADELGDNSAKAQIKLGGEIDAQMVGNNMSSPYNSSTLPNNSVNRGTNGISGRVKAMVNVEIAVKTRNFRYGGFVGIQTGKIEDDYGPYARETYIFAEHPYGKFEFGSAYSSAARMRVDPTNIARATGGIQGDWFRYIAFPVYAAGTDPSIAIGGSPVFILQPMLPNEAGFTTGAFNGNNVYNTSTSQYLYQNTVQPRLGWGSISNKISYYTKRIAGVQMGFSYSPNTGLTGVFGNQPSAYATDYVGQYYNLNQTGIAGNIVNLITLGLNYVKQFGDFGIATSFTYEHGEYQGMAYSLGGITAGNIPNRNDLNAFAFGIKGTYGPFSLAYSYGNWLQSLFAQNFRYYNSDGSPTVDQAYFHSAGTGVSFGPINLSVTYMYSNYRGNTVNLVSVGSDVKLGGLYGRGLVPYIEFTYYELAPAFAKSITTNTFAQAAPVNGFIVIGGLKLIF